MAYDAILHLTIMISKFLFFFLVISYLIYVLVIFERKFTLISDIDLTGNLTINEKILRE